MDVLLEMEVVRLEWENAMMKQTLVWIEDALNRRPLPPEALREKVVTQVDRLVNPGVPYAPSDPEA